MNMRPMKMEDADFLLEMKNYEETRQYAIISKEEIKRDDHLKWLESNIQYFQVADFGGKDVGIARIQDGEISIWIDKELWGKGFASAILKLISKKGHWCKIVNGNLASMRAFIRAGFEPAEYKECYYIFRK